MCVASWMEVGITILPGFVMDTMYYREDPLTTGGCYLNIPVQFTWAVTVQFLVYDLPPVLMIAAYPIIW